MKLTDSVQMHKLAFAVKHMSHIYLFGFYEITLSASVQTWKRGAVLSAEPHLSLESYQTLQHESG